MKICSQCPNSEIETKVDEWIAKGALTTTDLLSVEQAKLCLHTLDTKFKRYHMDIIHSLNNDSEIDKEHEVMDEHESRVAHIVVSHKSISSPFLTTCTCTFSEPATTIKTESKELDVPQ